MPLAVLPTPLVRAPRLAEALGLASLLVKRDDLTGFAVAGNKARQLQLLLEQAQAEHERRRQGRRDHTRKCAAAVSAAQPSGSRRPGI